MSYLVLARKWRPQGFGDLIGQEPISRILSNAIEQGRIAHAYLFSGPRGVGKTSTARILAKSLNCEKGPTPEPCGACASCRGIGDGSSMDVMEIDGASNNSVDDIRDLREKVKYAPAGGRYKVYIIDEAHMLSGPAFNALLKTLEEPPAHVVFVLATTAPRKIPATVLSRCQHLPFRKIPLLKIKQRLRMISDSERITISDPAIEMIARASEGGMRDSLTILDQVSAFSADIKESEVKDLLGIADFRALSELAGAVVKGDRRRIIGIIDELTDLGTDLKSFIKDLMQFFRDLLVAKVVARPGEILDLSENELAAMQDLLKATTEDRLSLLLSEMIRAEAEVRSAFSPRVSLEMALIRASFLSVLTPIQEAIENIESYGAGKENPPTARDLPGHRSATRTEEEKAPVRSPLTEDPSADSLSLEELGPAPVSTTSSPISEGASSLATEGTFRYVLLEKLESLNHLLAIKLSEAEFRIEDDVLVVTFSGGAAIHADSVKKSLALLAKSVEEITGKKVAVKIETEKKKMLRRKDLKERILSEPSVKEALELFEGRIVEIRPMDNTRKGGNNV
ncbi:MAG TPA: DNA polymerase III subunit gamma/tau [Thermodesulfovibrionales bacterium]|nr:DNA polymerase III subunit gamma/tau [Thermodesulfovibrionales bacterium]